MAKKYTRKQVGSLHELNDEQERVKRMAGKMEAEWLNAILNPQQIALSLITSLISRRKSNKGTKAKNALFSKTKGKSNAAGQSNKGQLKQIAGTVMHYAKQPAVTGIAKKVGISFLRWQAFNLAWFLGKKALNAIKKKREEQRLLHQIKNMPQRNK